MHYKPRSSQNLGKIQVDHGQIFHGGITNDLSER